LEKSKPRGAHPSAARSEPRADCIWTVQTSSDSGHRRPARAHDTAVAASPPTVIATPSISAASATTSCGYTESAPPTSSLFSSFSFAHAPPVLLLVTYRRRPPHPGPLSTFSSSHPVPVHLYNRSSSSPNNPSSPSPPLLPARRAPPRTARSSLSSTESTTPRALRVFPPQLL
jgi:hypothetical protein